MVQITHHSLRPLFLFAVLAVFSSCRKESDDSLVNGKTEIQFEINDTPGSDRFVNSNKLLIWHGKGLKKDGLAGNQVQDRDGGETPNDDIYWLHVGDVAQMTVGGEVLSASSIVVKDDMAYIGYHARGEAEKGAIEAVDISDPEHPNVVSQVLFTEGDVTSVEVDQNAPKSETRIWVGVTNNNRGGAIMKYDVKNGKLNYGGSTAYLSAFLSTGFTANVNSIKHVGDYLYATSGREYGGAFVLNTDDLSLIGKSVFSDAKYVTSNGNVKGESKVVVLKTGEKATLKVEGVGGYDFKEETYIGEIVHQNTDANNYGKSNIHFREEGSNLLFVSMGANGIKSFDLTDGVKETWQSPGDMLNNGNCNSVTTDENFLYAANGADGLAVFQLTDDAEPNLVFTWDLSEQGASANYVATAGDYMFVAKGQGGVKILKRPQPGELLPLTNYNNNGTPIEMAESIEVCGTLLPTLYSEALPETKNAQIAHPEFFAPDVTHNIVLKEESEVFITFLNEAAGYQNTLGYYYYDANNPPSTLEELTKIIVFPNASKAGSGGELVPGSTMELLGTFNENTVIGFFLISNGWQNGQITNGYYTVYSDPIFNAQNKVQSLIFHDPTCESTVLCFEDILTTTGGDKDYNDVIFQVTTSPAEAINKDLYLKL